MLGWSLGQTGNTQVSGISPSFKYKESKTQMATPDIGANRFYKLMLDGSGDDAAKHERLQEIFNKPASKDEIATLQTEYVAWRDFLRNKQKLVDQGITEAQDRLFQIEQGLGAPAPQLATVNGLHKEQEKKLKDLGTANDKLYNLLSIMFSAEGASKAFRRVASNDTMGLYLEVQAQNSSIDRLEAANANTQEELLKLASNAAPVPKPAAPAAVAKSFALGPEILALNPNVFAPERATFPKRAPRHP